MTSGESDWMPDSGNNRRRRNLEHYAYDDTDWETYDWSDWYADYEYEE